MRTKVTTLGGVAALLLAPLTALGAPHGDPAAAEALFAEAQALMGQGDYEQACPKFEESYRLDPATGALYAVALCHERQGKLASAWVEFMDVASRANAERYPEREQLAREHAQALRARLSFLTVRVDGAARLSGLVVTRNGVELGPAAWGSAIPLDPGRHEVVASAPGHVPWTVTLAVGPEPKNETVTIPRLSPVPAQSAATLTDPMAPAAPPAVDTTPRLFGMKLTPLRVTGIAFGAAGVASLGLSGYSTVRAVQKDAASDRDCRADDVCGEQGNRDRLAAFAAADLATVSGIAGGVLLGVGVTLFVLGAPDEPKTAIRVSPAGAELHLSF
jgi:hypothetical protein